MFLSQRSLLSPFSDAALVRRQVELATKLSLSDTEYTKNEQPHIDCREQYTYDKMPKQRRGVKFNHRNGAASGTDTGRRSSFSDISEVSSEPATEHKPGTGTDIAKEVRTPYPILYFLSLPSLTSSQLQDAPLPDYEKKKQSFITRTIWTLVMIGGFFLAMAMGHIYIILIVTVLQIVSFKEVIAIANVPSRQRKLRPTKNLNWYWLATTMYFLYGESVIYYFKHIVLVDKVLQPLATHHRFISFCLYVIGTYPFSPLTLQPSAPLNEKIR